MQRQQQISYLSLDWIMMGFTKGMPEIGIHDKLWPDEIATRLQDFLAAMIDSMLWTDAHHVIEGEAILPAFVRTLLDKHPNDIRAAYLGYTNIEVAEKLYQTKKHSPDPSDWLLKEPDEYIRDHLGNMLAYSRKIKAECEQHNVKYFDTSVDFEASIDLATEYLLMQN